MMNDRKWARIAAAWSVFVDLQAQQAKIFQDMINFLMDEEKDDGTKMEADKEILERI